MFDRLSMVISNHWSSVSPNLEDRPVQSDYGVVKVLRLRVSARIATWTRCVDGEDDKLSGPQDPALLELFELFDSGRFFQKYSYLPYTHKHMVCNLTL